MKPLDSSIWPALRAAAEETIIANGAAKIAADDDGSAGIMNGFRRTVAVATVTGLFLVISMRGFGLGQPSPSVAALQGIALVAWFCLRIEKRLWTNPGLFLFALAPVPQGVVFRRQFRSLATSFWILLCPTWAAIAPLAREDWLSDGPLLVAGSLAVAVCISLISASLVLVALGLAPLVRLIATAAVALSVITFVMPGGKQALLGLLKWSDPGLRYLSPTGWAGLALQGDGNGFAALGWLIPVAAVMGTVLWSLRRMEDRFQFREPFLEALGAQHGGGDDDEEHPGTADPRSDATAVRDQVLAGDFLRDERQARRMWVDALILRFFTPRQRLLARWMHSSPLTYGFSWRIGAASLLIGFLLGWFGRWIGWKHYMILWAVGGLIGLLAMTLRTSSGIRAFERNGLGQSIGLHVFMPVHLGELWPMEWKIFAARWFASLLPATAFGAAVAAVEGVHPGLGIDYAARLCACALPVSLLSQASSISSTIKIATGRRKVIGFTLICFLMFVGVGTGIAGAAVPFVGWPFVVLSALAFQGTISTYLWMAYSPDGSFAVKAESPEI